MKVVVRVNHHLDQISSEVLDGVSHSSVTIEARHHELLQELVGCDLLQKRRIKDPCDGGSWATVRLWRVFVDPLLEHLHEILDARHLRGPRRLVLIGVFLDTWGADL